VLLAVPSFARAQVGSSGKTICGASVADNLAAAQKALQSNNGALRPALTCLIEATVALNDRVHNDEDGHPASGVLVLPKFAVGPQPKQ
jgi:hypothetical protein